MTTGRAHAPRQQCFMRAALPAVLLCGAAMACAAMQSDQCIDYPYPRSQIVRSHMGHFRFCVPDLFKQDSRKEWEVWIDTSHHALRRLGILVETKKGQEMPSLLDRTRGATARDSLLQCIDCLRVVGLKRRLMDIDGRQLPVESAFLIGGFEHYDSMLVVQTTWRPQPSGNWVVLNLIALADREEGPLLAVLQTIRWD